MTRFGEYLKKKSANKAEISRKTGIGTNRLSELSTKPTTKIRGEEVYLIALALDVDATEILAHLFSDLTLKN